MSDSSWSEDDDSVLEAVNTVSNSNVEEYLSVLNERQREAVEHFVMARPFESIKSTLREEQFHR